MYWSIRVDFTTEHIPEAGLNAVCYAAIHRAVEEGLIPNFKKMNNIALDVRTAYKPERLHYPIQPGFASN